MACRARASNQQGWSGRARRKWLAGCRRTVQQTVHVLSTRTRVHGEKTKREMAGRGPGGQFLMPDHGAEPHPACPSSPPERAQPNLASPRPQLGGAPPNSSRSRSVASNPPARRFTGMGMIWQVKGGIVWRQIFLFLRVRVCVRETPTLTQSEKPESDDELTWLLHQPVNGIFLLH